MCPHFKGEDGFINGGFCIRGERAEHISGSEVSWPGWCSLRSSPWTLSLEQGGLGLGNKRVCVCPWKFILKCLKKGFKWSNWKSFEVSVLSPGLVLRENQEQGQQVSPFPSLQLVEVSDSVMCFLCFQWVSLSSIFFSTLRAPFGNETYRCIS